MWTPWFAQSECHRFHTVGDHPSTTWLSKRIRQKGQWHKSPTAKVNQMMSKRFSFHMETNA